MPIPEFDEGRLLPAGIHDCTLEEVATRFGRFRRSDRRQQLMARLHDFLREIAASQRVTSIIIDGSFVTDIDESYDIYLIVVMNPRSEPELLPFEYNLLSRRRSARRFGMDVLTAQDGSELLAEVLHLFQRVKTVPDRQKGLPRIQL